MCVFFYGGSCVEDVSTHLMYYLFFHPKLKTCSGDTILRAIKELTTGNITYTSPVSRKLNDYNTAYTMNEFLIKSLISTGALYKGLEYDLDFDRQFIEIGKYDAKTTYKKFTGYSPGVAVIGEHIVGVENRDGNANVRFCQQHTLERIFTKLEENGILVNRVRIDFGSCSEEIVDTVKVHCKHFYIRANRCSGFYDDMFILRGWRYEEINGIEFELTSIVEENASASLTDLLLRDK